jgi:DNA-binding PadR family transcriptional regulator
MRKSGPPKGLIAYLVPEVLEEKPRYGYEILKEIREISGGHWEPSYGSVYPILCKFEEKGWAERIEREDEPDRKYFELTDDGRAELAKRRESGSEKARDFADVILGFVCPFGSARDQLRAEQQHEEAHEHRHADRGRHHADHPAGRIDR